MKSIPFSVPLIREYVPMNEGTKAGFTKSTPEILSISLIVFPSVVGFLLSLLSGNKIIFLVFLVCGIVFSASIYFMRKLIRPNSRPSFEIEVLKAYKPVLSFLGRSEFRSAVASVKSILGILIEVRTTRPQFFAIVDESVKFFLEKLALIANAQNNDGLSAKITATMDTQSFETLRRLGHHLTGELENMHLECETARKHAVRPNQVDQDAARMLGQRIQREGRVLKELELLGLS